eukprot:TRINITY_DN4975_c0_g1_i2.p1 TRINITY_DN4975_c0_g1~~TRINITY_DN4975_c0_g1_i2.p1  ORF type:complete len:166 (+),score=23.34 TRINITY_DN4975_c0_g1_i2:85-582(+)
MAVITTQVTWIGKTGANECYACWKCDPCCGPGVCENPKQAAKCCACWYFTGLCSLVKLHSSSMDEAKCGLCPNGIVGIMAFFCSPLVWTATRYNIRAKRMIPAAGPKNGLLGDCLCSFFCSSCAACQNLRAADPNDWDWLMDNRPEIKVEGQKFALFREQRMFPK